MKKSLPKLLVCAIVCCLLLSVAISGKSSESPIISGSCGENVTWSYDTNTYSLSVSGKGNMEFETVPWKSVKKLIRSVNVEDGITSIEDYAFSVCNSLTSVSIPESVTVIGASAFARCNSLIDVNLPEKLEYIGQFAFDGVKNFGKSITIPESTQFIGACAFTGCDSVKEVTVNSPHAVIDNRAFDGAGPGLIIRGAKGSTAEYLARVSGYRFYSTTEDPVSVGGSFGENMIWSFDHETGALTVSGEGNMPDMFVQYYFLNPEEMAALPPWFSRRSQITSVIIGDKITSVGNYAFWGCTNAVNISLPDSLTAIGVKAFSSNESVKEILIPENVTLIGENAFSYCYDIEAFTVATGNPVYHSDEYGALLKKGADGDTLMYYPIGNTRKAYTINENIAYIDKSAFDYYQKLSELYIYPYDIQLDNQHGHYRELHVSSIHGHYGSTAEAYAKRYVIHFTPLHEYSDVPNDKDYRDAIYYVVAKGLFNGVSETEFAPESSMTRAMFATVLARLDGADTSAYGEPSFSDLRKGEWYTESVGWAAANGIVNGMGDGTFDTNGAITIEQTLTILYRYENGAVTDVRSGLSIADFDDASTVSSWATDAVNWAVENGVYEGKNSKLMPKAFASRADIAQITANYTRLIHD